MLNKKHIVIVSNGIINDFVKVKEKLMFYIGNDDFTVISVDGGFYHLEFLKISPDIILGDFDSVDSNLFLKYGNAEIIEYNSEKDYTDTEIAIRKAIELDFENIYMVGCTGERLDHTLANIFLLSLIKENGKNGYIIDSNNRIELLENESKNLKILNSEYISILPLTNIDSVTITGLKYNLKDVALRFASTLTISNELSKNEGNITPKVKLGHGKGLLIYSEDRK